MDGNKELIRLNKLDKTQGSTNCGFCNLISLLMTVALGMKMLTGNNVFAYFVLLLAVVSIFTIEALIPVHFVVLLTPVLFDPGLSIGIDKIFFPIIIIAIVIRIVLYKNAFRTNYFMHVALILLIIYISAKISHYSDPFSMYPIWIMNLISFFAYSQLRLSTQKLYELANRFLMVFFIVFIFFALTIITTPTSTSARLTLGEDLNVNRFAIAIAQISITLMFIALMKKKGKTKTILFVMFILGNALILLTGSRSSSIATIIGALIVYILYTKGETRDLRKVIPVVIFALLLSFGFHYLARSNELIGLRYSLSNIISSEGSGATRYASLYLELTKIIPEHLFWGVGPSATCEMDAVAQYGRLVFSSHNIIFSMLTQIGLIGSVAVVSLWIRVIQPMIKNVSTHKIIILPLAMVVTGIINGIGEQIFCERMFWASLGFCVLFFNSINDENIISCL